MTVGRLQTEADVERFINDRLEAFVVLIHQLQGTVRRGDGDPEGNEVAPLGVVWLRRNGGVGTTLYVKNADDGLATGWDAVA